MCEKKKMFSLSQNMVNNIKSAFVLANDAIMSLSYKLNDTEIFFKEMFCILQTFAQCLLTTDLHCHQYKYKKRQTLNDDNKTNRYWLCVEICFCFNLFLKFVFVNDMSPYYYIF